MADAHDDDVLAGMDDMDDVVRDFVAECLEQLEEFDRELVDLERNPDDREALASAFRVLHNIKGTAGILGFTALEAVAHAGEGLLARLRDGLLPPRPEVTTAVLRSGDAVRVLLERIGADLSEGDPKENATLVMEVERLAASTTAPGDGDAASAGPGLVEPPTGETATPPAGLPPVPADAAFSVDLGAPGPLATAPTDASVRVDVAHLDELVESTGELVLVRNRIVEAAVAHVDDPVLSNLIQRLSAIVSGLQDRVLATRMQPIESLMSRLPRVVRDLAVACGKTVRLEIVGRETELDRSILERIRDPLTHIVRNAVDHGIELPSIRIAAGKDPEGSLRIRAFHDAGQVVIEIADDGAGMDVDAIRRTAVERGFVDAEEAASLEDQELVNLTFLPGFSTTTEVTRVSGRGVGMDVVSESLQRLGGTIDVASHRGRGTTIRLRIPLTLAILPSLIVETVGVRFALAHASVREIVSLGESGDTGSDEVSLTILRGTPVLRLRGRVLPLVHLADELGIAGLEVDEARAPTAADGLPEGVSSKTDSWRGKLGAELEDGETILEGDGETGVEGGDESIVVVQTGGRSFGLVVDRVIDTQEIVVQPLGAVIAEIPVYVGATVLGDGRVALILDVPRLARRARIGAAIGAASPSGVVASEAQHEDAVGERGPAVGEIAPDRLAVLICQSPDDGRTAVPVRIIKRLEELPRSTLERAGGRFVIQHRGRVIPVIPVADILPERRKKLRHPELERAFLADEAIQVVICAWGDQRVGLVVHRVLDIVEASIEERSPPSRDGVLFNVVIAERVTEVLDFERILAMSGLEGVGPPISG